MLCFDFLAMRTLRRTKFAKIPSIDHLDRLCHDHPDPLRGAENLWPCSGKETGTKNIVRKSRKWWSSYKIIGGSTPSYYSCTLSLTEKLKIIKLKADAKLSWAKTRWSRWTWRLPSFALNSVSWPGQGLLTTTIWWKISSSLFFHRHCNQMELCRLISILTHLFYTTVFTFMFLEALHTYRCRDHENHGDKNYYDYDHSLFCRWITSQASKMHKLKNLTDQPYLSSRKKILEMLACLKV